MKKIILGALALISISSFASSKECFVYFQTLEGKAPSKELIQAFSSLNYKFTRDVFVATHIARYDSYGDVSIPLVKVGQLELYTKEAYLQRDWKNGAGGYSEYLTYSDMDSHFLSVKNKIAENLLSNGVKCGENRTQIGFVGSAPHSDLEIEFGHEGYL